MIVGLDLLDIGGELLEALGIIDLGAERDREMLAAGMLIGVAGRQERQEHLVVPAEIGGDDVDAALDIVEDRAVVLANAARRSAGAAGVDEAGEVVAARPCHALLECRRYRRRRATSSAQ